MNTLFEVEKELSRAIQRGEVAVLMVSEVLALREEMDRLRLLAEDGLAESLESKSRKFVLYPEEHYG